MTYVYVSNAEDGDIATYRRLDSGALEAGPRVAAAKTVMAMVVSHDRRFLYAVTRAKPCSLLAYAIDPASGALHQVASSPLFDSFPYVSFDQLGRFLLFASYGGNLVAVYAVGADGAVSHEPLQVINTGLNAHSIRVDNSNCFVFVPHLGSNELFQFRFDAATGKLTPNSPPVVKVKAMTGPRHLVFSGDNRFAYVLNELLGTVTTFSLDAATGLLAEIASVASLPSNTKLVPGGPRGAVGVPGAPARDTSHDIWAADIHLTPDGKFLYTSERTGSTLSAFSVDSASGKLTLLGTTPTEQQPRGFAIDPSGRFLVASGEKSATISSYAIDQATGALRLMGKAPAGKGANWVEIVRFA